MNARRKLQAGGTLNPRRHVYIERREDAELLKLLRAGEYVNILTPRQMGKSSLMVRTLPVLREEGVRTASIDLAAELGSEEKPEAWFKGLISKLARELDLSLNVGRWWAEHQDDTPGQRLQRFFRDVACVQIAAPTLITVFLDEIDSTLKHSFTDGLFTAIRGMYNERSLVSAYERVSFCLLGVATPNELIKDHRTTAYNIGHTLSLRDFDLAFDDLSPLLHGFATDLITGRALLERILHWTGGQPYLTLKLIADLAINDASNPTTVDYYIGRSFSNLNDLREEVHFQQVQRFVETRLGQSLKIYEQLLDGKPIRSETAPLYLKLELSGLVRRDANGYLVLRNPIYARLFDREWLAIWRRHITNEEHSTLIKQGVEVWNIWRGENPDIVPDLRKADLSGENLRNADLRGTDFSNATLTGAALCNANLTGANLRGAELNDADLNGAILVNTIVGDAKLSCVRLTDANLRGADLSGADLSRAVLVGANLATADLRGANLHSANFTSAYLGGANLGGASLDDANLGSAFLGVTVFSNASLRNADLRGATLIDSQLDGANLTGVKLWKTQLSGWSIKRVICKQAFWDEDGKDPTEYEDGDFERIFAEKPRIMLRYSGGMSPVDLAMLPLIIERLQAEHPNCALHIRSVQDDGGGAIATITVEDRAGQSVEAFAQDVEVLRGDFAILQQRVHQEERLRLQAESSYRTMVQDLLPKLLERTLPKTEVNIGRITGPVLIESVNADTYTIHGQAGAVGSNVHTNDMILQQIWSQNSLDLARLTDELARLRAAMKQETDGMAEQDEAIGAVAAAEKAAMLGDAPTVLRNLQAATKWTLHLAEKIGLAVATEAIKRAL